MDKGVLNFDIKTGMKNIIGRDLITDDFIAIYELVKNSYDAYADAVKVIFNKDEIIIADNGKGMSKNDLEKKWFAVAYSAKKDKTEDIDLSRDSHLNNLKSRRFYAGAKGVGRFSCDRLGTKLELITSKVDINETYKVDVDWGEFEKDSQQSFDSIQIPFESIENNNIFPKNKNHGTILKIQNLNSNWDIHKLRELRRSLEKLINPFSKENSFSIEIEAKQFIQIDNNSNNKLKINGIIDNSILKVLDLKTTQIDLKLKDEIITTKIIDRGALIYHIEEPNKYLSLIDDLEINLYFLNRSAKINFGRLMDIEPVKYGNVFLFKNGFRVQPYGNVGDDSWELDNRKQQGYNRFLGTRDLFGKVDLITENFNEFKEVSSRAGGLVETLGKKVLFDLFKEKAFLRLERYVVGVLWGEAFKRKNYFLDNEIAQQFRLELQNDKDKDSYEDALNNLGSKIDFVNLIKTLSDDNDIKIITYNRELVNLVNEKLDVIQPKFLSDLEKIAEKTNDSDLLNQVKLTEESFNRIIKEKEEAEKREDEERNKRIEAEKQAELERFKREEAEKKQREEEEKRRRAELETLKKEKERAEAELAKIKAEQKAKEEEEKNKNLKNQLNIETKKNQYLNATRKTLSEDAEQLVHSIDLYVGNASTYVNELLVSNLSKDVKDKLYSIKSNIDKAIKVSQIIIKSNFDYKHTKQRINLPIYIREYIEDLNVSRPNLKFKIDGVFDKFYLINPIEIDIVLDNLVSNSIKAKANEILIDFEKLNDKIQINYYDNGLGMSDKLINNSESIFELGVRESSERGSGIGMFDVKKRVNNLKGDIKFLGNNLKLKGAAFQIII
ncbi:ATP-binding protein [Flavobacterium sharifuzzamanii]|uniref:ATP-binding protein n=1 Tax=Flavobacterium sharifuzzamanii TaxID=2211133 RepID=UPI000DACF056|nr:ATP-binding protein [Flavobacterium sharifuzzamanii]KAF2079430.1 ATP-binding protein [Flavobacterium sharifuzzamanii]